MPARPLLRIGAREKCRELKERVKHVRGAKARRESRLAFGAQDPITILRFLRARQGRLGLSAL